MQGGVYDMQVIVMIISIGIEVRVGVRCMG